LNDVSWGGILADEWVWVNHPGINHAASL